MTHARRSRSWIMAAIALFAVSTTARAQDLDEVEDRQAVQPNFELHEQNFYNWVFGQANQNNRGEAVFEPHLLLSVAEIERACSLTEIQKKKLLLAGRGDIKRFMDRVAEARKVFDMYRHDQNAVALIHQETLPLGQIVQAGLFGADSLFAKTVATTLDPDQATRYREAVYEKALFRHRAKVQLAIANLDTVMGFTAEQRRRLTELAIEETRPSVRPAGRYETQAITLKIARIPEAKLRPLLDPARWAHLEARLQQARGLEVFLQSNGYLDELAPLVSKKK